MGDPLEAVCVINLCSFPIMKGCKGLPLLWEWALLVCADADVAAVPGRRGTAGGRAAGRELGGLCCNGHRAPRRGTAAPQSAVAGSTVASCSVVFRGRV